MMIFKEHPLFFTCNFHNHEFLMVQKHSRVEKDISCNKKSLRDSSNNNSIWCKKPLNVKKICYQNPAIRIIVPMRMPHMDVDADNIPKIK